MADGAVVKVAFTGRTSFVSGIGLEMELNLSESLEDTPIVVYDGEPIEVSHTEERDYHLIATEQCVSADI